MHMPRTKKSPPAPSPSSSVMWTILEATEALRVSKSYIEKAIQEGRMPAYKVGRLTRLDPADVLAFAKQTPHGNA
ncbi:hypothetical protein CH289_07960 [Rhodococcus sp. RS1C4]|nr:hypothetical protein CH289_07960 [Rhodococcus sp. RS1C4]